MAGNLLDLVLVQLSRSRSQAGKTSHVQGTRVRAADAAEAAAQQDSGSASPARTRKLHKFSAQTRSHPRSACRR